MFCVKTLCFEPGVFLICLETIAAALGNSQDASKCHYGSCSGNKTHRSQSQGPGFDELNLHTARLNLSFYLGMLISSLFWKVVDTGTQRHWPPSKRGLYRTSSRPVAHAGCDASEPLQQIKVWLYQRTSSRPKHSCDSNGSFHGVPVTENRVLF